MVDLDNQPLFNLALEALVPRIFALDRLIAFPPLALSSTRLTALDLPSLVTIAFARLSLVTLAPLDLPSLVTIALARPNLVTLVPLDAIL